MSLEKMQILHVNHIGDTPEDVLRVSFAPSLVKMITSRDIRKHGRDLKDITVFFHDGDLQVFEVSGLDLMRLEQVVAGYTEDY